MEEKMTKKRKLFAAIAAAAIASGFFACQIEGDADPSGLNGLLSRSALADGLKVLLSYTVLDASYENPSLKYIAGEEDATSTTLGTVNDYSESGMLFRQSINDPVIFTYTYGDAPNTVVRGLLANIESHYLQPSTCTYSVLKTSADGAWQRGADITFTASMISNPIANPHGLAQVGKFIYLIDYETQFIYVVTVDQLETGGTISLDSPPPFNLGDAAGFDPINWGDADAYAEKGQAVIALSNGNGNYLYALYIKNNNNDPYPDYELSKLAKLYINPIDGSLSYDDEIVLDLSYNATEIVPVLALPAEEPDSQTGMAENRWFSAIPSA
jgi:hypothetical protein